MTQARNSRYRTRIATKTRYVAAVAAAALLLAACGSSDDSTSPSEGSQSEGSQSEPTASSGSAAGDENSSAAPTESASPSESATTGSEDAEDSADAGSSTLNEMLPDDIQSAGVITVASTFGFPPQEFYKDDGTTPTGISVGIAKALGEVLDVEFKFENVSFSSIIPGIMSGRYDVAISAMSATDERAKQVTFVTYLEDGGSLLVKKGNPSDVHGLESLCGKTSAQIQGTAFVGALKQISKEKCVANDKKPIDILIFQNPTQRVQALLQGRADASYTNLSGNAYTAQQTDGQLEVLPETYPATPYGIAMTKDRTKLADALLQAMKKIIANGSYEAVLEKWDVTQGAIEEPKIIG